MYLHVNLQEHTPTDIHPSFPMPFTVLMDALFLLFQMADKLGGRYCLPVLSGVRVGC